MASRFWVGGNGTWDATAGTKWATTSGGSGGASVPTTADDVFFDANSGAVTVSAAGGGTSLCRNLDCTGFTGTLANGTVVADGSVTLASTMTTSGFLLQMESPAGVSSTLTTGGKTIQTLTFNGSNTSTVTLADALTVVGTVTLSSGTLNTNGKTCSWGAFSSSNSTTRTLTLGASAITLTGVGTTVWNTATATGLTITANTSIVTMNGAGAVFSSTSGLNNNGLSIVYTGGGACGLSGSVTLKDITFTGTAAKTDSLQIGANPTATGTFTVTGNSKTNRVLVRSGIVGTQQTITAATVSVNAADFQDIAGAGAGSWNLSAASNFTGDAGGNSGITFTTAAPQTWQGTSGGNWSTAASWTSRVPLPQDDVSIASAFVASQTITLDMPRLGKNVSFVGTTGSPTIAQSSFDATLYGSLTLAAGVGAFSNSAQNLVLAGRGTHTITSAGKNITGGGRTVVVQGGSYTFADQAVWAAGVSHTAGTLDTGSLNHQFNTFSESSSTVARTLTLGSSTITLTASTLGSGVLSMGTFAGLTITANTATFVFSGSSSRADMTISNNYNGLSLSFTGTAAFQLNGSPTLRNLTVSGGTTAQTVSLSSSPTVTGTLTLSSTFGRIALIGAPSTVTAAAVSLARVDFTNITAAGAAGTWTGYLLGNVSGNTNITFTTRFWVGGTGNWSDTAHWSTSSGGATGASVPTSSLDAAFDGNSGAGTATLNVGGSTATLDFTGYTGTFALAGATLNIFGGVNFSTGMTLDQSLGGTWFLAATTTNGGAGWPVTCNGKTLASVEFAGVGGKWKLQDPMNTTTGATVRLTAGTLDTNSQNCSWGAFGSTLGNVRTITLGSSQITITGVSGWNVTTASNLTITANTATVTLTASGTTFAGAAANWNGLSVVINGIAGGSATITSGTVANLTITGSASKTGTVFFTSAIAFTVTGTLTINGNSLTNRLIVQSNTLGTARQLVAATTSLSNVDFQDIAASGAGAWSGTSIGDALGNTGITFTPSAQQTWQGTSGGNWSDVTKWTSRVPLPQDDVVINAAFTAGQTVTADMPRLGKSVSFVGATGNPTWSRTISNTLYGSLTLIAGMTTNSAVNLTFGGRSASYTITTAGKLTSTGGWQLIIAAPGATYTLQDDLVMKTTSGSTFALNAGTFDANGFNVTTGVLSLSSGGIAATRTIRFGSGTWTLNATGAVTIVDTGNVASITIIPGTALIDIVSTDSATKSVGGFAGVAQSYPRLRYTAAGSGALAIVGNLSFPSLDVECSTARTLSLTASGTVTVNGPLTLTGSPGQLLSLVSSSPGTTTTIIANPSGAVTTSNLSLSSDVSVIVNRAGGAVSPAVAGGGQLPLVDKAGGAFATATNGGDRTTLLDLTGGAASDAATEADKTVEVEQAGGAAAAWTTGGSSTFNIERAGGAIATATTAGVRTVLVDEQGGAVATWRAGYEQVPGSVSLDPTSEAAVTLDPVSEATVELEVQPA